MIKINNLIKKFDGNEPLFDNFSLYIEDGKMVALMGPSGCGKSTLLNIIGSLETIDGGSVKVDDINVQQLKGKQKQEFLSKTVSFLFQTFALMEDRTVVENVTLNRKSNAYHEVFETLGLSGKEQRIVKTLSGGEQQRVALARIMVKDSKVILADEPTGNLDEMNADHVMKVLKSLNDKGKTVVVVTHDRRLLHYFDAVIAL